MTSSWMTYDLPELCHIDLRINSEMDKHGRLLPHNQEVGIKVFMRRSA
jgi:hypothetical protein